MINTKTAVKILGLVMVVALTAGCIRILKFQTSKVIAPGNTGKITLQVAAGKDLQGQQFDLTVFILPPDGWTVGTPTYSGGYGSGVMAASPLAKAWLNTDEEPNNSQSDNCGDNNNYPYWVGAPFDPTWQAYSTPPVTLNAKKFWKVTIPVTAGIHETGEGLFKIILAWSVEDQWICGASVITFIDTGVAGN